MNNSPEGQANSAYQRLQEIAEQTRIIVPCRIKLDLRTATKSYERLTHFRLGPVINDNGLMSECLTRFCQHFYSKRDEVTATETLFIGIDAWGAWMAAEVGAKCRVKSIGISLRGSADDDVLFELTKRLPEKTFHEQLQQFIFFTDIVVTGKTYARAKELIKQVISAVEQSDRTTPKSHTFLCFGLIKAQLPDSIKEHVNNGKELDMFIFDQIPVPIVSSDELPDEQFFPMTDFRTALGLFN